MNLKIELTEREREELNIIKQDKIAFGSFCGMISNQLVEKDMNIESIPILTKRALQVRVFARNIQTTIQKEGGVK